MVLSVLQTPRSMRRMYRARKGGTSGHRCTAGRQHRSNASTGHMGACGGDGRGGGTQNDRRTALTQHARRACTWKGDMRKPRWRRTERACADRREVRASDRLRRSRQDKCEGEVRSLQGGGCGCPGAEEEGEYVQHDASDRRCGSGGATGGQWHEERSWR